MRRNHNRTFYFINTVDSNGRAVVKVASDFAPVWGKSFDSIPDAMKAIQRRNKDAVRIDSVENGVVAVYEANQPVDGDTL